MSTIVDAILSRSLLAFRRGKAVVDLIGSKPKLAPATPPPKRVLLERRPETTSVRITYPDGQTELLPHNPLIHLQLTQRGIPPHKVERALDYVWNFYELYVECDRDPAPPALPALSSDNGTRGMPVKHRKRLMRTN